MSWSSNNNAIFVENCNSLQNLTVTFTVSQDLITLGNNGFSLQLNCYPQTNPQATYKGKALEWMQYVIAVENNAEGTPEVQWGIQYWSTVRGSGFNPPPGVNYSQIPGSSAPSNQVLAGSVMSIALVTDSSGNVTQATFSITDPKGKVSSYTYTFPSDACCAIYGFQVNLVGPPSGTHTCQFTSGAGTLIYGVSPSGALAVQSMNTCGGPQIATGETSNAAYGQISTFILYDIEPPPNFEIIRIYLYNQSVSVFILPPIKLPPPIIIPTPRFLARRTKT